MKSGWINISPNELYDIIARIKEGDSEAKALFVAATFSWVEWLVTRTLIVYRVRPWRPKEERNQKLKVYKKDQKADNEYIDVIDGVFDYFNETNDEHENDANDEYEYYDEINDRKLKYFDDEYITTLNNNTNVNNTNLKEYMDDESICKEYIILSDIANDCIQNCWDKLLNNPCYINGMKEGKYFSNGNGIIHKFNLSQVKDKEKSTIRHFVGFAKKDLLETISKTCQKSYSVIVYPYEQLKISLHIPKVREEFYSEFKKMPTDEELLRLLNEKYPNEKWNAEKLQSIEQERKIDAQIDITSGDHSEDDNHKDIVEVPTPYDLAEDVVSKYYYCDLISEINRALEDMHLSKLNKLEMAVLMCLNNDEGLGTVSRPGGKTKNVVFKEELIKQLLGNDSIAYTEEDLNKRITHGGFIETIGLKQYIAIREIDRRPDEIKSFHQLLKNYLSEKGYYGTNFLRISNALDIINNMSEDSFDTDIIRRQLVTIALESGLNLALTNDMLRYFGQDILYARSPEDFCAIFALNKRLGVSGFRELREIARTILENNSYKRYYLFMEDGNTIDNDKVKSLLENLKKKDSDVGEYSTSISSKSITRKLSNLARTTNTEMDFAELIREIKEDFTTCRERTHRLILQAYLEFADKNETIDSICNHIWKGVSKTGDEKKKIIRNLRRLFEFNELPITRNFFLIVLVALWRKKGIHRELIDKALFDAGFRTLDSTGNYIDRSIIALCGDNEDYVAKRAANIIYNDGLRSPHLAAVEFITQKEEDLEKTIKNRYIE